MFQAHGTSPRSARKVRGAKLQLHSIDLIIRRCSLKGRLVVKLLQIFKSIPTYLNKDGATIYKDDINPNYTN